MLYVAYLCECDPCSFRFCVAHREAAWDLLLFCVCGAIGQLFIFFTIRRYGSLVTTIVTTTRKFFNILLSVLWVGNPLLVQQWIAVGMVFTGLFTSTYVKTRNRKVKAAGKSQ
jgi:UDP-galactose transporter B1